nr:hypothetical protein [Clostridia bacterium]
MPVKVGLKYIEIWKSSMENAVQKYESEPIIKDQIVFYGPSNFTRWGPKYGMKPLREVMLGKSGAQCCINRGFGSSCAEHQLYYYPRMIRPLEPRVMVYSSAGNGSAFGYTNEETFEIAQRVVAYALTDFPDIRIYLTGGGRRPVMTDKVREEREEYNAMIKEFAENTPNCKYVDIYNYTPLHRADIFVEDGVHFNQAGYDIYADMFREVLADELAQY